jgi:hypothetical protein
LQYKQMGQNHPINTTTPLTPPPINTTTPLTPPPH